MKDLSDKQFDELLKQKTESFNYDFDESAWNKMEQKLRRRDRIVFIRNSSSVLLLLFLCAGTYLLFDTNAVRDKENKITKQPKNIEQSIKPKELSGSPLDTSTGLLAEEHASSGTTSPMHTSSRKTQDTKNSQDRVIHQFDKQIAKGSTPQQQSVATSIDNANAPGTAQAAVPLSSATGVSIEPNQDNPNTLALASSDSAKTTTKDKALPKSKKLAFSVTAMAGPDFSSIKSFEGSKGTLNFGILLNAAVTNRITLSLGARYGPKSYAATGYNYQLKNPSRADKIEGIDATCDVLELPLQVSYALLKKGNRQIRVSSGLSSYLMVKEAYNFRYSRYSGYKDYLLVKNNENQHYLSVLSLSASYEIKPKSSPVRLGIEPYLKLPLGGVGEGNVRLKSSGISLNLTYDISKKIK